MTNEEKIRTRVHNLASQIFEESVKRANGQRQYPDEQAHRMACMELIVEYQAKQTAALFNIQVLLTKLANNPQLYEKANDTEESYHRERGDHF